MGSGNSRRRRRYMDDRDVDDETGESGSRAQGQALAQGGAEGAGASGDPDLSAILSYLIRSGQVRIMNPSGGLFEDEDDFMEEDDEEDDCVHPDRPPRVDPNPDTSFLDQSQLKQQILRQTGQVNRCCPGQAVSVNTPVCKLIQMREVGIHGKQQFSSADCRLVTAHYLPNHMQLRAQYQQKAFCGTYSQDGAIFLSACQDRSIRIYDTACGEFKLLKSVHARDVGWSVLDTAFSPDGNYLIYSSWSEFIHLCNIYGEYETHHSLPLLPSTDHSFCIFSLCFSQDNREILGGANDGCLYVYDRDKNERILKIDAHEDDVNAVAFADESSQILFSGADDGLCKVWDRRTLNEDNPVPVGVLAGHTDGITYIDSKKDARYLISNSKDQTIKLWDMRRFSAKEAVTATRRAVQKQKWDYRWQQVPSKVMKPSKRIIGDTSLMTYRGHSVLNTLVRCRFSPSHSTGQRYIYSGCATGSVVLYDVLTGKIVTRLNGHRACVRDVSWHPYENKLISTSWDSTIGEWTYREPHVSDSEAPSDSDSDDDDEDDSSFMRRSSRLKDLRRRIRARTSGGLFSGIL